MNFYQTTHGLSAKRRWIAFALHSPLPEKLSHQ